MKLLQLFRILTPADHKNWERFLQSPYFRVSDRFLLFYRQLKKKHPAFNPDKEGLKVVYQSCFGKENYTDSRLYNLMSDMARQLERFLALEVALGPENDPPTYMERHLLITSLDRRNAGAYFRDEAENFTSSLQKQKAKGPEEWYFLHKAFEQVYYNPDTPKAGLDETNLPNALNSLILYALASYFRYAAEWKNRELMLGAQPPIPYLDVVLEMTSSGDLMRLAPIIEVYRAIVLIFQEKYDGAAFERLVELFQQHGDSLPREDKTTMLRQLINYGIRLMAEGAPTNTALYQLYKDAEKMNILLDHGRMPHVSFLNIVLLGAMGNEFEFVQHFIEAYGHLLVDDLREPVKQLARATLHYQMGNLDEAQEQLSADVYRIPGLDFAGRNLMIRITLDRFLTFGKDEDFLIGQLDAMEQFVKNRKNISEHKKLAMLHYLRIIRAIVKVRHSNKTVAEIEKNKLVDKVNSLTPLNHKQWLLEKIQML